MAYDKAWLNSIDGGNSDGSNNNTPNTDPKKKETYVQKTFRQTLTSFIVNLDNSQNMSLSAPANDKNVNAYLLFYQWIMGAGPSVRNFDEGSIMGQQMLKAPEVMATIKKAIAQSKAGNYDDVPFARSLGKEVKGSPMAYIKDFYKDVNGRNPARGFHGSFAGRVTINSSLNESNVSLVNLTIIMSDNMTATSGTRSSPLAGGYGKSPIAVYPEPNPYGPRGQFRTIKVNYRMNVNVQSGIKD